MVKENQQYPDQRDEGEVHKRQSDGELLSDQPGENYLYTHVIEQIRKLSPGGIKILVNPLLKAERTSFFVGSVPDTGVIMDLRRRLQREGLQTQQHPDFPSYFLVRWP